MEFAEARHLLHRVGFGATPAALSRALRRGSETTIKFLIDDLRDTSRTQPLAWAEQSVALDKRRSGGGEREQAVELSGWWLREMVETTSPLTERLVLIFFEHFGSSFARAPYPPLLARHLALLRKHVGGDFKALLLGIVSDPAFILSRGGPGALKADPGEGLARALLEATIGPGQGEEEDVRGAAGALTGWGVDPRNGAFRYDGAAHRSEDRRFLGGSGKYNGTDVVNLLLADPRTSERVVELLWLGLIGAPGPDAAERARLATAWRAEDLMMKPLLASLLGHEAIRDASRFGEAVKSPVELLVGAISMLYLEVEHWPTVARACAALGQDLVDPPAAGWPAGVGWLTAASMDARHRWSRALLRESGQLQRAPTWDEVALKTWLGKPTLSAERARDEAVRVLLAGKPLVEPPVEFSPHELILHLMLEPGFQLT